MDFFDFNESLGLSSTFALDPIDRSKLPMIDFTQSAMLTSGIVIDNQSVKLDDNLLDDPMIRFIRTPAELNKQVVKQAIKPTMLTPSQPATPTKNQPTNQIVKQTTSQPINQITNQMNTQINTQPAKVASQQIKKATAESINNVITKPSQTSHSPQSTFVSDSSANQPISHSVVVSSPKKLTPKKERKPRQKAASAATKRKTQTAQISAVDQPAAVNNHVTTGRSTRSKKQPIVAAPVEPVPPPVKLIAPTHLSAPVASQKLDPRTVRLAGEKRARDFLSKKGKGAKKAKTGKAAATSGDIAVEVADSGQ